MEVFGYRKLIAYQKAKEIVKSSYKLLKKFPSGERYALCDQLRRASVSITSNIAEGVNRYSVKDKSHFIEMAYGSLMEVYCQLILADDLHYLDEGCMDDVRLSVEHIGKMLSGLQASFERMSGKQQNPNP